VSKRFGHNDSLTRHCLLRLGVWIVAIGTGAAPVARAAGVAPTELDLKAAYCLEIDKDTLTNLEQIKQPIAKHAIDRMQALTGRIRTYVAMRLSESVDPTAIALAIARADSDVQRLRTEHPADQGTLNKGLACIDDAWLPD
jgi:hypothetical protein